MNTHGVLFKATTIWLILVALTLLSVEFPGIIAGGDGHDIQLGAIVVLTFLKVSIIGWKFMELDHAPALLRSCFLAWVFGIGGSIMIYAI